MFRTYSRIQIVIRLVQEHVTLVIITQIAYYQKLIIVHLN